MDKTDEHSQQKNEKCVSETVPITNDADFASAAGDIAKDGVVANNSIIRKSRPQCTPVVGSDWVKRLRGKDRPLHDSS